MDLPVKAIYTIDGEQVPVDYLPLKESFERLDEGLSVPAGDYVMARHEIDYLGTTRHTGAQPNQIGARPAVVNAAWGIETLAKPTGDYIPIPDIWQRWFLEFWNHHTGYRLPLGQKIGTHTEKNNPKLIFTDYTPGSLLDLYAGMIRDAKSHTDSASPETGARDVVTGRNLSNKKPWEWLCRPTTGALLKVIQRVGTRLKIEAIDLYKPPPDVRTLPLHLFYFGTQVHIDGSVTRYPDVKRVFEVHRYPPAGTAMPLVAPGGYFWIDKKACTPLTPGEIWTPYLYL